MIYNLFGLLKWFTEMVSRGSVRIEGGGGEGRGSVALSHPFCFAKLCIFLHGKVIDLSLVFWYFLKFDRLPWQQQSK